MLYLSTTLYVVATSFYLLQLTYIYIHM